MRIALHLVILLTTLVFVACSNAPATKPEAQAASPTAVNVPEPQKASIDPKIVDFMLTSAATDFHKHPPGDLAHFRNVRIGHVPAADGTPQYRMCGEFSEVGHEAEGQWTAFATLKTSGYEQYIGGQSTTYCQGSSFVWDGADDLSSQLQSKFDSLRKGKK